MGCRDCCKCSPARHVNVAPLTGNERGICAASRRAKTCRCRSRQQPGASTSGALALTASQPENGKAPKKGGKVLATRGRLISHLAHQTLHSGNNLALRLQEHHGLKLRTLLVA